MLLGKINTICTDLSPLLQIIGYLILILKILLPLILIVIITIDLTKTVISKKSEDTKNSLKNFALKLAICILIYFVPMISMILMSFVGQYGMIKAQSGLDYDVCYNCMFNPTSDICEIAVNSSQYK